MKKLILATRKSPLALAQTEMVAAHLRARLGVETELLKIVTTGDQRLEWSLEERGGKGLFTKELEHALLNGDADAAVHSAKDLPGDMPGGLAVAGYLPRADARDVLVLRAGITSPKNIATSSPRRRLQIGKLFPGAQFCEIRGNVDTRLRKIAGDTAGGADATLLAAAGLARLGIGNWPGVEFRALGFESMVPAVGQAAIAVQCRAGDVAQFAMCFDAETARCVSLERAFQSALGGGCHTALGVHVSAGGSAGAGANASTLWFFHERVGVRRLALTEEDFARPSETAGRVLGEFGFQSFVRD